MNTLQSHNRTMENHRFTGEIVNKLPCSIAMLNYQRVNMDIKPIDQQDIQAHIGT